MQDFHSWQTLYERENWEEFNSDEAALLWLKLKSIMRKPLIDEFVAENQISLNQTSLNQKFIELYALLVKEPSKSHIMLNAYMKKKNKIALHSLDTTKLVSELYKLKSFEWGGDYQNSLDKYLVSRYVKVLQSYEILVSKFATEISVAVQGYVLNSWYNHWSSILIEHIFKSHPEVLPTVGQIKHLDFFIRNTPFDLKVTYLPAEYIKAQRKDLGLPVELTYLKQKAKELKIEFDKKGKPSDIYYEIFEKMNDKNTQESKQVIDTLKAQTMNILLHAQEHPKHLARWLYENQGEMRFGSENRLFLVLVDTNDFSGSWKLKRNLDLLQPVINSYLDNFADKNLSDLKISFKYKGKPQTFTALTDVIFVVK
ncbi:hypothetical protein [Limnospira fusiformis]|uniref:hypothetical protein n=1 Tax=Limnospira fusiformis TaxID=54297 RepID=UPI001449852E|nr:hypothetical protein HFV01_04160 [Limnospira fusiformis SAG 85.79]